MAHKAFQIWPLFTSTNSACPSPHTLQEACRTKSNSSTLCSNVSFGDSLLPGYRKPCSRFAWLHHVNIPGGLTYFSVGTSFLILSQSLNSSVQAPVTSIQPSASMSGVCCMPEPGLGGWDVTEQKQKTTLPPWSLQSFSVVTATPLTIFLTPPH